MSAALAALDLAREEAVQVARGVELGEVVAGRELLRALEDDSVLRGDCGARWKRIAFSRAMAQGSVRVISRSRSAWVNSPSLRLMISTTPMVRPREMSGAARMDRVWNCVLSSNFPVKRGSFDVSFTIVD